MKTKHSAGTKHKDKGFTPLKALLGFIRGRYTWMFTALILLFVVVPFLNMKSLAGTMTVDLIFTVIIITAIRATAMERKTIVTTIALAVAALLGRYTTEVVPQRNVLIFAVAIEAMFFAYITVLVLVDVLSEGRVTTDKVFGSICVYIFIGLVFGELFMLLDVINPGSFNFDEASLQCLLDSGHAERENMLIFFSFVTLTTLGYGDITPVTAPASALASVEAIIGNIYLATLVARMVGLNIAHGGEMGKEK